MALKLDKVSRGPHLPALVASSISREIAQGRLKPGDRLPTEQALATTFGVSRNVVREAIARLRSEGRIWSHQGRGAFVSETTNPTILTIDHDALQNGDAFRSLFELREVIEGRAAALAAERHGASDIRDMRRALAAMREAPYGSVQWLKADLEFHLSIAKATRNSYMAQFLGFIAEHVRESILAAGGQSRSDDMAQVTLAEHERILAAIEGRDAGAAQEAMHAHLIGAAKRVGIPAGKGVKRRAGRRKDVAATEPLLGAETAE
jgi:GntR family transcriptional regulator, transcriptional repressor for pyruvate dehydrogenase complex